jgi:hypothetical protein
VVDLTASVVLVESSDESDQPAGDWQQGIPPTIVAVEAPAKAASRTAGAGASASAAAAAGKS